jgi:glycosyltransferase involved in cell wall biosynthesis
MDAELAEPEAQAGVKTPVKTQVDVDFTLGLNNLTGKYFFGRDMIESSADLVHGIYYWRMRHKAKPEGLYRRVLGRLALWETQWHQRFGAGPLFRTPRPLVFTDPREVIYTDLKPYDVVLCHDMGPISHPDLYAAGVDQVYLRAYEKIQTVKPFMLFVSASTRDAFAHYFGDSYPAMRVVYIPPRKEMGGDSTPPPDVPDTYLLTVGAVGRRKNQHSALLAYAQSGLHERGIDYVICGGPEPGAEAVMELARQTPGVVLTGYVPDDQLRWLYTHALGFVLPSRLEGFGVPAMEAILYRAMPLVTRGGALNEVTGDNAILVDDTPDSIAEGMRRLADMKPKDRKTRLDAMRAHIRKFDFDKSAATWRQTLLDAIKVYESR